MELPAGDYILRSEVLKVADSGEHFNAVFVTADRRRGTGGDLIEVKDWQKILADHPGQRVPGRRRAAIGSIKAPNHWENKTINIHNPNNKLQHPISMHIRLIQFFNGKRVVNG
jgi:hypothetical protein